MSDTTIVTPLSSKSKNSNEPRCPWQTLWPTILNPLPKSISDSIPQEILDIIIDSADSVADLQNLSLVSWPWFHRSRRSLFNRVTIRTGLQMSHFIRDLEDTHSLFRPNSIRGLDISRYWAIDQDTPASPSSLLMLPKLLNSIQYLSLMVDPDQSPHTFDLNSLSVVLDAWRVTLTHVVLRFVGYHPGLEILIDLLPIVFSLPNLYHLSLDSLFWNSVDLDTLSARLQTCHITPTLRSLHFSKSSNLLLWRTLVGYLPPLDHICTDAYHNRGPVKAVYRARGSALRSLKFASSYTILHDLSANTGLQHLVVTGINSSLGVDPNIPRDLKHALLTLAHPAELVTLTLHGMQPFQTFDWPGLLSTLTLERFPKLRIICIAFETGGKTGRDFINIQFRNSHHLKHLRFFSLREEWAIATTQCIPWPLCYDNPQIGSLQPAPADPFEFL